MSGLNDTIPLGLSEIHTLLRVTDQVTDPRSAEQISGFSLAEPLAGRAPRSRPAPDGIAPEGLAVTRTAPGGAPTLMKKPARGRRGIARANTFHGSMADIPDNAPEFFKLLASKLHGMHRGVQTGPPEDFVGHPVPEAWKAALG